MAEIEIDLEILPGGYLRFNRSPQKPLNDALLAFLKELGYTEPIKLEDFFEAQEAIQLLLGDEAFCG